MYQARATSLPMSTSKPKVSILIPTFNQERFINTCIASALAQTYDNLEVVVGDDASEDATGQLVYPFLADPRVHYERNPTNMGRTNNYRRLLNELATGDWVLMLDGDDCLVNFEYVAHALELALSAPDVVLVFGRMLQGLDIATSKQSAVPLGLQPIMDGTTFFSQHPPFYDATPYHLTCLFRRDAAIRGQCYRHDILSTDLESFYRLMIGHKIGFLNEVVGLWRQHDRNTSKTSSYNLLARNFVVFTGPYEYATSLGIFSKSELKCWRRKGAARYLLRSSGQMLANGHIIGALCLIGYVMMIDPGIVGHAIGRAIRWMMVHIRPNGGRF
jgi:glycosyltransferase involved in cell wall biosynthesis